jgi:DNA mismatch repair protein MSH4
VSLIDMLQSFAFLAINADYSRPEFGDVLAVKESFHPIFKSIKGFKTTANNIYAANESSIVIITGPNMSGKSSYLQQVGCLLFCRCSKLFFVASNSLYRLNKVAMLQVMAQCGSFVPATRAHFRVTSQIFSRMAPDDNIEVNSSLFEQEMIEMNYIVENFTDDSLVLIDELCRSTGKDEGIAISIALLEHMSSKPAFVFFATHLSELTALETIHPNVSNQCFAVRIEKIGEREKIDTLHVLSKGVCSVENYGRYGLTSLFGSSTIRRIYIFFAVCTIWTIFLLA